MGNGGLLRGLKFMGIVPKSLPLAVKMGGSIVKLKLASRKASKTFKKELEKQGLDYETAEALADIYKKGADLDFGD